MMLLNNVINNIFRKVRINGPTVNSWVQCLQHHTDVEENANEPKKGESKRMTEFRKKLKETTPIDDLGEQPHIHPSQKENPLPPWPDNTNPHTGEIGGPRGPEPTRYGDWERKGRVTDF